MSDLSTRLDKSNKVLYISYCPKTDKSIYDICDINGSVIKTGEITKGDEETEVDLSELSSSEYLLLVLDGDDLIRSRFSLDGKE